MAAKNLPEWQNFALGSVSPAISALFTNPFEVAKVRKQMDGELSKKTSGVYKGTVSTLKTIYTHEGLRGLQSGLTIAVLREGSKNLFRIGAYQPILNRLHTDKDSPTPIWKRICAGAVSGSVGALVCNPIEIVKTRMQGHIKNEGDRKSFRSQHQYRTIPEGFKSVHSEFGLVGMWKFSVVVSMARSAVITAVALPTYTMLKQAALDRGVENNPYLHIPISLVSAFLSIIFNNPLDVLRNRLYNQKDALYKGPSDAFKKIVAAEGYRGFYKGFWQHYMRSAPHSTLTFVIFEQLSRLLGNDEVD
eukprot:TRINITY_DN11013_c0_g1_i1.p1 TRINITY_DN11013_c0_g1~~TRINITY_DN11013_c0_g1_i1.p1  ORF type:complete len:304 (+),score=50.68 TRINITY_DN11013_c0_g1_i1:102-1013(+)